MLIRDVQVIEGEFVGAAHPGRGDQMINVVLESFDIILHALRLLLDDESANE